MTLNRHIRKALSASGEAVIAGTTVDGRHYLKFTLLNPETTVEDIARDPGPDPQHRHQLPREPAGAAA